jgi:glycosyltransferase involved in cell wall biosynthesis
MRIAYFSPLNPQKSGISDYSEVLIPSLEKFCDIDLWVSGIDVTNQSLKNHTIIDYVRDKKSINKLNEYDAIIYNIGNNPYYHADMYDIFLKHPSFVILHDYILYYLITGYYLEYTQNKPKYIAEFYYNYGLNGIDYAKEILRSRVPPLEYRNPQKYPLVKRLIENAIGVIAHSEYTRNLIIQQGAPESKVMKINQVNYFNEANIPNPHDRKTLRAKYGINEDDILVASFGYIASTKRNLEVIEAINKINTRFKYKIKYLMVGEGDYIDGLLSDNIKKTGFIPLNEFERLLYCSDIVANLRYPSMGETSATLLRAISASKPCIVTDDAWFSELPDNSVIKIPFGAKEMPSLIEALILLMESADERMIIGKNAREYALKYHDPSKISSELYHFIKEKPRQKGTITESYNQLNNHRLQEIGVANKCDLLSELYRKLNSDKIKDLGLKLITNIK